MGNGFALSVAMRSFAGRRAWEAGRHQTIRRQIPSPYFIRNELAQVLSPTVISTAGAEKFRTEVWQEISRFSVSIKCKVLTAHTGMSSLEMTMGLE